LWLSWIHQCKIIDLLDRRFEADGDVFDKPRRRQTTDAYLFNFRRRRILFDKNHFEKVCSKKNLNEKVCSKKISMIFFRNKSLRNILFEKEIRRVWNVLKK
jgi:hypothetical protein